MWEIAVEKILLPIAKSLGKKVCRILHGKLSKEFSVVEIVEALEKGKISLEKTFKVHGTFSEYIPFTDFTTLIKRDLKSEITGTCRIGDLVRDGSYLGALFPPRITKATEPAIPLVYSYKGKSAKMFSYSTGDQLTLECRVMPLDYEFRNILYRKECFCIEDKPIGLEIVDVYTRKPKKTDEFIIDAFFLTSLDYEEGVDELFSSLNEIGNIWMNEIGRPIGPTVGVALTNLSREGKISSAIVRKDGQLISYEKWIEKKLCRFSCPINILEVEDSNMGIKNMKDLITNFTFIDPQIEQEYRFIWDLFRYEVLNGRKKRKGLSSTERKIFSVISQLSNRADLKKAWDFYLQPKLDVDFQFDQVNPVAKQTINPRAILKQKGLR